MLEEVSPFFVLTAGTENVCSLQSGILRDFFVAPTLEKILSHHKRSREWHKWYKCMTYDSGPVFVSDKDTTLCITLAV